MQHSWRRKHNFVAPLDMDAQPQGTLCMIPRPVAHAIVGTAPLAKIMIPGAHVAAVRGVLHITRRDVLKHNPDITKEILHGVIGVCI